NVENRKLISINDASSCARIVTRSAPGRNKVYAGAALSGAAQPSEERSSRTISERDSQSRSDRAEQLTIWRVVASTPSQIDPWEGCVERLCKNRRSHAVSLRPESFAGGSTRRLQHYAQARGFASPGF